MDNWLLPENSLTRDQTLNSTRISQDQSLAGTSTATLAATQTASLLTAVSTVEPTTWAETVLTMVGLNALIKLPQYDRSYLNVS